MAHLNKCAATSTPIGHCFRRCLLALKLCVLVLVLVHNAILQAYNTALKMRCIRLHMGWDKACRSRDTASTVLCGPYQLDSMHTRFSHVNAATHQSCSQELTLLQFGITYHCRCIIVCVILYLC